MARQITYGDCSRQAILRGVDSLANGVRVMSDSPCSVYSAP
jgi:hypothetical protein